MTDPRPADPQSRAERKRAHWASGKALCALPFALLIALPALFMWDFVLGRQLLYWSDFNHQWIPWQKFVFDSVARGQAPFWNPYLELGFSQLGESQVGVFYPFKWLSYFMDIPRGLVFVFCAHLAFAGVGMYRVLRDELDSRVAPLFGAISFELSGYMFAQLTNYNIVLATCYLPWFVWTLTRFVKTRRLAPLGYFSLLFGSNLLISHGGTTFIVMGGTGLFFLVYAALSGRFVKDMLLFFGATALGALFASVQLFPTLELKRLSVRSTQLAFEFVIDKHFAMGFLERLSNFFPWLLGNSRASSMKDGFEELHYYAGAIVPLLALFGALSWKRVVPSQKKFLIAVAVSAAFAGWLSLGGKSPLFEPWALLYRLPGFDMFRIPARWGVVFGFGLSVFAAFGLSSLLRREARPWLALALGVALPVLALGAACLQEGSSVVLRLLASPRAVLSEPSNAFERFVVEPLSHANPAWLYGAFLVAFVSGYWAFERKRLAGRSFAMLALGLLTLDLFLMESPINPRTSDGSVFQSKPGESYFSGSKRYCRFISRERGTDYASFPLNLASFFPIFSANGHFPLESARFIELRARYDKPEVLDYVGACYEFRHGRAIPREGALPRAFVISDVRNAGDADPLQRFLHERGARLKSVVYLSASDYAEAQKELDSTASELESRVEIVRFENQAVALDVETPKAGLLVMTDVSYPGWIARLDGKPTRLYAAQGLFRGVVVPAGHHRVEFVYRSRAIASGAATSVVSLGGFGIAVLLVGWRRRRSQHGAPSPVS